MVLLLLTTDWAHHICRDAIFAWHAAMAYAARVTNSMLSAATCAVISQPLSSLSCHNTLRHSRQCNPQSFSC